MPKSGAEDEILQIFYAESKEHLDGIQDDLLAIEHQGADIDQELVNSVFRAVHTIKGGCGFFGLDKLSKLSHVMENVLGKIRSKEMVPTTEIINVLLAGADLTRIMIDTPEQTDALEVAPTIKDLERIFSGAATKEDKKNIKQVVNFILPSGNPIFSISNYEITSAQKAPKGGERLYLIEYDLISDVEAKGRTPWDVISELMQLVEFIDSKVDVESIGDMSTGAMRIPFYVLISTIIEPDLLSDFLGLKSNKIHNVDAKGNIIPSKAPVVSQPFMLQQPPAQVVKPPPPQVAKPPPLVQPPPPTEAAPPPLPDEPQHQETAGKLADPLKSAAKSAPDSIRVNVNLLDKLVALAGELVLARNQLVQNVEAGEQDAEAVESSAQRINLVTAELQEAIMSTRMQTIGIVFNKFQRVVRDLSKELGKEVELEIEGDDVELDKSIIESINDPLTHIVRNSIDHGLERPSARVLAGKPTKGKLRICASHEAGHVVILIKDDGAGINLERVKAKAVASGFCTREQAAAMPDKEAVKLIFKAGLSTAEKVSDLSGRGVGMDVVNTNITRLGGTVDIETALGIGTTIKIKLPLTLAIIPCLMVAVGDERYAIPQVNLLELVRVGVDNIAHRIETVGGALVMRLRDKLLPLLDLNAILERDSADKETPAPMEALLQRNSPVNIVVVASGDTEYGLIVDQLMDSAEIVVKPLGRHLSSCKAYAGATILGDGEVALILDINGISQDQRLTNVAHEHDAEARKGAVSDSRDKQTLLLVTNSPNEHFAIPLGLVLRIERVPSSMIESTGGIFGIKYRGGSLPLLAIEDVAKVSPRVPAEKVSIVVFKTADREVGLLLSEVLDIVTTSAEVDATSYRQPGIFGSAVINDHITLLIDLFGIAYTKMPHWKEKARHVEETPSNEPIRRPVVLIAEDSKFFMSQIRTFMQESDYDVLTAEDGAIALELLKNAQNRVDIILTDIEMPNMDGLELTRRVRADSKLKGIPIIAVTSIAGEEAEQKGFQAGVDEYLIKLDRDMIIEKCAERLASRNTAKSRGQAA